MAGEVASTLKHSSYGSDDGRSKVFLGEGKGLAAVFSNVKVPNDHNGYRFISFDECYPPVQHGSKKHGAENDGIETKSLSDSHYSDDAGDEQQLESQSDFSGDDNPNDRLDRYRAQFVKTNLGTFDLKFYSGDPLFFDEESLEIGLADRSVPTETQYLLKESFTGHFGADSASRREEARLIFEQECQHDELVHLLNETEENDTTVKLRIINDRVLSKDVMERALRCHAFNKIRELKAKHVLESNSKEPFQKRTKFKHAVELVAYLYLGNGRIVGDMLHLPGIKVDHFALWARYAITGEHRSMPSYMVVQKVEDIILNAFIRDPKNPSQYFSLRRHEKLRNPKYPYERYSIILDKTLARRERQRERKSWCRLSNVVKEKVGYSGRAAMSRSVGFGLNFEELSEERLVLAKIKSQINPEDRNSLYYHAYYADPINLDLSSLECEDKSKTQKDDLAFLLKEAFTGFSDKDFIHKKTAFEILQDANSTTSLIEALNSLPENDMTRKLKVKRTNFVSDSSVLRAIRYRAFEVIDICRKTFVRGEEDKWEEDQWRRDHDNVTTAAAYMYLANGKLIGDILHLPGLKNEELVERVSFLVISTHIYPSSVDVCKVIDEIICNTIFGDPVNEFTLEPCCLEVDAEIYCERLEKQTETLSLLDDSSGEEAGADSVKDQSADDDSSGDSSDAFYDSDVSYNSLEYIDWGLRDEED